MDPHASTDGRRDASVVLLHGQPGTGSDWDAVLQHLPRDLHTVAVDRPGYLTSPHPPGGFEANAQWLLEELDSTGVRDAVLVGHSFGGGVALSAALLAPERIRALVLVASVGPACLDRLDAMLAAPVIGPACAFVAWQLTPWLARRNVARIERTRGRALDPHELVNWDVWGNARHEHGAMWRTFLVEQRDLVRTIGPLSARLGDVAAPTVVIADPADRVIPVATAYHLRDRIPDSRLMLVDQGGHHLPRRVPHVVAAEIIRVAGALS